MVRVWKKELDEIRCPKCNKKGHLVKIIKHRLNYPHGRKSNVVAIPIIIKYFCNKMLPTENKNEEKKKCDFKEIIRLNHGEIDYIGG